MDVKKGDNLQFLEAVSDVDLRPIEKKRLQEIKDRLSKTTAGHWEAVEANSMVRLEKNDDLSDAEDDCIRRVGDKTEILGSSEWIRVNWDDLVFMAEAKADIEFLLGIIENEKTNS